MPYVLKPENPMLSRAVTRPLVALALLAAGCATVETGRDYQQARTLVGEGTGVGTLYDPAAEDQVAEAVHARLEDGLTIDEAVEVALLNNRALQAMFQDIGMARADVVQAGLLTNPSLSMLVQFPEGGGRSKIDFGIAQQIADLWQIPQRTKIAQADLEATVLRVAQQAVDLAADTRIQCLRLQSLERLLAIQTESLQLARESLRLAEAKVRAGEASQLDLNLAKAGLSEVELLGIDAQRQHQLAYLRLKRMLALSRTGEMWNLTGELVDLPPPTESEGECVERALTDRLDARIAAEKVTSAEAVWEKEKWAVFPNVTVGLSGERSENRSQPGRNVLADTARASIANGALTGPDIQSRAQRRQERSQIIDLILGPSFDITLPIWDQNQARIARAQFAWDQKRKEQESLLDSIAEEVLAASVALRSAAQQRRLYDESLLPQSRENLKAVRSAYAGGELGMVALIESQEAAIRVERAYLDVVRDLAIARVELERAVGGRLNTKSEGP